MNEYADSSFIVSLYAYDNNHKFAAAHAAGWTSAPRLPLTPFGRFELQNTLRRVLLPFEAARVIDSIREDVRRSIFRECPLESYRWMKLADELSRRHVWGTKTRALDVLHVSAALLQGCSIFLTLDDNQRKFARLAGLSVPL